MPFALVPLPSLLAFVRRSCPLPMRTPDPRVLVKWRDHDRVDHPSTLEWPLLPVGDSTVLGHCAVVGEGGYLL